MTNIGRSRWKKITSFPFPTDIFRLVYLCEEFEEVIKRIDELLPYINSELFRDAFIYMMRIINSYVELMDNVYDDEKDRDDILKDIHQYIKFLYDREGKLDISNTLVSVKSIEDADLTRRTFFMPMLAFINAKIYDPLSMAVHDSRIGAVKVFLTKSFKRRGALPIFEEDISSKFKIGTKIMGDEDNT